VGCGREGDAHAWVGRYIFLDGFTIKCFFLGPCFVDIEYVSTLVAGVFSVEVRFFEW